MTHTPHTLADEFPDYVQKISALKQSDAHFAKLVDEYNAVNERVFRAETRLDLMTQEQEEVLRKQRALVKDHLWMHIKA
jgi:uncharacterized protein